VPSVRPNLLLSDKLELYSMSAIELIMFLDFDKLTYGHILNWSPMYFHKYPESKEFIDNMKEWFPKFRKFSNLKNKTAKNRQFVGEYKSQMEVLKKRFKEIIEYRLEVLNLKELTAIDINDSEIWELHFLDISSDTGKEALMITSIVKSLLERKSIISLDQMIENVFGYNEFTESEKKPFDFIKIPLWDMPLLDSMTLLQLIYSRDNLKPSLISFSEQLTALTDKLAELPFSAETHQEIKQLCAEKLSDTKKSVQKVIDESIYFNYLKNQLPAGNCMKFCLGVSSVENLINYYEKINCIEPYMASEIKQQISRHIPLNTSYVFSYNEFHKTENVI
jgi:hypothetical protein